MSTLELSATSPRGAVGRPSARGVCFWYQSVAVSRASASCRYRIGHFVELTRGADVVIGERLPASVTKSAHTVVCVRPLVTPALERDLADLRRRGLRLIADYDDLLFAGDVSGLPSSATGSGDAQARQVRLGHYAAGLRVFDRFLVSTRAIQQRLNALAPGAPVTLVPNGLSAPWVEQGRALYPSFEPGDPLVIRYFSGSPSHDRDFASILGPLGQLMSRHGQVQLDLVGHLDVDTTSLPADRVRRVPSVPYDDLPRLLSSSWVNLAPLARSDYGTCKSALKFLEAGAFRCPTLASPSDDMMRHRELGAPVSICEDERDWLRELERMLDLDERMRAATDSYRHVMGHGMAAAHANVWLQAVNQRASS